MLKPRDFDQVILGDSSARSEVQLRIEGRIEQDMDVVTQRLWQVLEVTEVSRDYPNRRGEGMCRYLKVRVRDVSDPAVKSLHRISSDYITGAQKNSHRACERLLCASHLR